MKLEEFLAIRETGTIPDDLPLLLQALLLDAVGDWDSAHKIAQKDLTPHGSWVHAYLHRKEGDMGNASYWYLSAGKQVPALSPDEEWEYISQALLEEG